MNMFAKLSRLSSCSILPSTSSMPPRCLQIQTNSLVSRPPPIVRHYGSPISIFTGSHRLKLHKEKNALAFVEHITVDEQRMVLAVLSKQLELDIAAVNSKQITNADELAPDALKMTFLINTLPFLGFGFLDNMIMIVAGEYIDATLGVALSISTMAAAGFGNLISDIFGVGLAHYVEIFCGVFLGIRPPSLTPEQMTMSSVRYTAAGGKVLGLTVGCLIGMFPLLFFDNDNKSSDEKKS